MNPASSPSTFPSELRPPPGYRRAAPAARKPVPHGVEQSSARTFMRLNDDPPGHLYDASCVDLGDAPGRHNAQVHTELTSCCSGWDLQSNGLPKGSQDPKGRAACAALANRARDEVYVRDGEPSYAAHVARWSTALAVSLGRP